MKEFLFTSESVTDGHPDKICDQISDAILDEALRQDPQARMAVETSIKDNFVLVFGECNTSANIDYEAIAKSVLKDIGYNDTFEVLVKVQKQSSQINAAVQKDELAAGDQGIMFGYATNETEELMPMPIDLAHKLAKRLSDIKIDYPLLKPDGKTQVTVNYQDGLPKNIHTIVISASHDEVLSQEELYKIIVEEVITPTIDPELINEDTKIIINPSGEFSIAGPYSDSGTTGRKIVVDTYGGMGRIGGGAFSSKDPSKVDRSAAYYARYVAKSIVHAGLCDKIEIQVSYAIGLKEPLSIYIDTFGTHKVSEKEIMDIIQRNFNFNVPNIIEELDLLKPIYRQTTNFGHFGRKEFSWEYPKKLV